MSVNDIPNRDRQLVTATHLRAAQESIFLPWIGLDIYCDLHVPRDEIVFTVFFLTELCMSISIGKQKRRSFVNSNYDVFNVDSDTPIMNSDTPSLHSHTLNLDSDEVREKSECVIGKSDTNVWIHVIANSKIKSVKFWKYFTISSSYLLYYDYVEKI